MFLRYAHFTMGKLSPTIINTAIFGIVAIVVLFSVFATLMPEAQSAAAALNDSTRCTDAGGYYAAATGNCQVNATNTTAVAYTATPLSSIFGVNGVIFLVIMASLIVVVVKSYIGKK